AQVEVPDQRDLLIRRNDWQAQFAIGVEDVLRGIDILDRARAAEQREIVEPHTRPKREFCRSARKRDQRSVGGEFAGGRAIVVATASATGNGTVDKRVSPKGRATFTKAAG